MQPVAAEAAPHPQLRRPRLVPMVRRAVLEEQSAEVRRLLREHLPQQVAQREALRQPQVGEAVPLEAVADRAVAVVALQQPLPA